jgi:hypothetical protein
MISRRVAAFIASFLAVFSFLCFAPHGCSCCHAQMWAPLPLQSVNSCNIPGHVCALGFKKFVNSFTSYQFPNPFPPGQDPLSRLEFPIDQWFCGLSTRYNGSSWFLRGEGWINISRESSQKMQDSDWDDESATSQKTIFSESQCTLNKGLLFDITLGLPMPSGRLSGVNPVVGWRYQQFVFTTHDGYQDTIYGDFMVLEGPGIEFRQSFYHLYLGFLFNTHICMASYTSYLPDMDFSLQVDYGLVTAKNEDLHLLREGNRITIENGSGHCWHIGGTLNLMRTSVMQARIEADFKRILTHGGHQLTNNVFALNFSFDGSKVWSDQTSLSAVAEFKF